MLRIWGENFDVDDFIFQSKISAYNIYYKGSPKIKSKPEGKKIESSGCSQEVSSADFDNFKQQIQDAIDYLNNYQQELQHINTTPEIQYAILDFGVEYDPNKFTQTQYLPTELLKLSSDLGIGIEISIYQGDK
nr:hypothetical protein [Mucilaginibacter sp. SP1R1]MBB6152508.1 hypothetical protein [Mucilaginibacter sp. SP1R1]